MRKCWQNLKTTWWSSLVPSPLHWNKLLAETLKKYAKTDIKVFLFWFLKFSENILHRTVASHFSIILSLIISFFLFFFLISLQYISSIKLFSALNLTKNYHSTHSLSMTISNKFNFCWYSTNIVLSCISCIRINRS